jgi:hypothetical protein
MQTNKLLQFKAQMDADMLIILPILSPFFIFLSLPFSFAYLLLGYFNSQASFPNLLTERSLGLHHPENAPQK